MTAAMEDRVKEVVEDFLRQRDGRPPLLAGNDNLLELGYLDSTEYFDLIAVIEERLDLRFDFLDAAPEDLVSIAGLARLAAG